MLGGVILAFAENESDMTGNFVRVACGAAVAIGGILVTALSLAAYQASVVVVDIADVMIDQRTP